MKYFVHFTRNKYAHIILCSNMRRKKKKIIGEKEKRYIDLLTHNECNNIVNLYHTYMSTIDRTKSF